MASGARYGLAGAPSAARMLRGPFCSRGCCAHFGHARRQAERQAWQREVFAEMRTPRGA